ncbi:MAG: ATP-binding protein [Nitrospirae bacterium]|nr:ATP-binding protein [Nitrospirota bacterium]
MSFSALSEKNFIGRKHEIETLYGVALDAGKGTASSVFLSGQRGVGKTELLKQVCRLIFLGQNGVMPFFYIMSPAIVSVQDFALDYSCLFISQWIAFHKKEHSLLNGTARTPESVRILAEKSGASWAVETIEDLLRIRASGNVLELFLYASKVPFRSHVKTGVPATVIIDEFQKIRDLAGFDAENNKNLWMLFEEATESGHVPHILTGVKAALEDMLYNKTAIGHSLDLISLHGLGQADSLSLIASLIDQCQISVEKDAIRSFAEKFDGNPAYIRNFVQAVRRSGMNLSFDDLWKAYFSAVSKGKFYTYWLSQLRMYMPQLDLRKASLKLLYQLGNRSSSDMSPNLGNESFPLAGALSISMKEFESVVNTFQTSGIMAANFSTFELMDDRVLNDVLKVLYNKEVLKKPLAMIEEELAKETYQGHKYQPVRTSEKPLFEVTIPISPKAELIAVNALEKIAGVHNIPADIIGQIQIAVIDLLSNITAQKKFEGINMHWKFEPLEDTFAIELKSASEDFMSRISEDASANDFIKRYLDEINMEEAGSGTKLILKKDLKKHLASKA